jgi:hypothetical protein
MSDSRNSGPDPLSAAPARVRNRNRGLLVAILLLFFGSMLFAGILRFSGWMPEGRKNNGTLLDPPLDLRQVSPSLRDGGAYPWNPDARTWRIAVAPPAGCGDGGCAELVARLDTTWRLFGKDADRVDVLWVCGTSACLPPESAPRPRTLRVLRPESRLQDALSAAPDASGTGAGSGMSVYVIDPNGFVILRYPAGFDPVELREDMVKLLKLI